MKNTRGKVLSKEVMITERGERCDVFHIARDVVDRDFTKIFVSEIVRLVASARDNKDLPVQSLMKLLLFLGKLLELADKDNVIRGTRRALAERFGVTERTLQRYWSALTRLDIIRKRDYAEYVLNPELFAQVGTAERLDILTTYRRVKTPEKGQEDSPGQTLMFKKEEKAS